MRQNFLEGGQPQTSGLLQGWTQRRECHGWGCFAASGFFKLTNQEILKETVLSGCLSQLISVELKVTLMI